LFSQITVLEGWTGLDDSGGVPIFVIFERSVSLLELAVAVKESTVL
jgi:hypothetical protein